MTRAWSSWHKLVQSVQAVEVSLEKALTQQFGFGLTDFRALVLLASARNRELRMQDLAAKLALNQSSVTRLVERLERLGLTTRDICPDDKRGVFSVLSDRGASKLAEAAPLYEAQLEEALAAHGEALSGHLSTRRRSSGVRVAWPSEPVTACALRDKSWARMTRDGCQLRRA